MNVYTISTQALEKIDIVLFRSMLQLVQKQLNAMWSVESSAKIVLVDIEQPEGKAFWDSQLTRPEILMIAYAKKNFKDTRWFLPKPIRVQPLVNLLNAIATQITSQNLRTTSLPRENNTSPLSHNLIDLNSTEKSSRPVSHDYLFDPSKYLLGLVQTAVQTGQAKRFSCAGLPPLYVLPNEQRCFTSLIHMGQIDSSQRILYGAFAEHIESADLPLEILHQEVEQQKLQSYPLETILWLTTLYASHGRLIHEQAQDNFVQLKQWPNFINLPHHPVHINLAAFMLRHTTDLKTISAKTHVLLPSVIDFVNACQIIGLIIEEKHSKRIEDKHLPEQKRQLFKSILKRLRQ
ncbi:MAG: hypothetical protein HC877_19335 [Thioploca sp.]|nr:hypothetical protein [Thioploca sp.]